MKKYEGALFIFRRDLRLNDNTALIKACELSKNVLPVFVFEKKQRNHEYFSENAFEFMINSIKELQRELNIKGADLVLLEGDLLTELSRLKKNYSFEAIFLNKDYTPFSKIRDEEIKKFCEKEKIDFISEHDYLLNPPGTILNNQGEPYKVFTPFYKASVSIDVSKPKKNYNKNYARMDSSIKVHDLIKKSNHELFVKGGRQEAIKLLESLKNKEDYLTNKDYTDKDATSKLSAHLKFGTVSVREVYWFINDTFFFGHPLTRQLYWRDFFTHIAFFYPHVFGREFKERYSLIKWDKPNKNFEAWKKGETGFPLVDAGMRQLNATGWMHGRTRMLTGSFLVKNLGLDWRLGEKYFATKLVDYDPSVNNGNWQWVASTGCDAQPYFRVFNPVIQQQKFDPECKYIKKWVLELKEQTPKEIHEFLITPLKNYFHPIINYKESLKISKTKYEEVLKTNNK